LWAALEEGSGEPVNTLTHSWTKQQGYPVVSVKLKDGKLELEQVGHGDPQNPFDFA
jgi:puromycin-sensitive aminopeptidase